MQLRNEQYPHFLHSSFFAQYETSFLKSEEELLKIDDRVAQAMSNFSSPGITEADFQKVMELMKPSADYWKVIASEENLTVKVTRKPIKIGLSEGHVSKTTTVYNCKASMYIDLVNIIEIFNTFFVLTKKKN